MHPRTMVEYALVRTKRKTIGIYIRDGHVEVRAPSRCPRLEIDRFVASKEKWILEKLAMSQEQETQRRAFLLNYGDMILYRGKEYPLVAKCGIHADFDGEQFCLPQNLTSQQIKDTCIKIYRRLAKAHFTERVMIFAAQMGVNPTAVKVNSAKTRWGSCSSRGSINFSWMLIMADDYVIDYVVVHELAHLTQLNHSAKFWSIVRDVLPDYLQRAARLKKLQSRLATENWK